MKYDINRETFKDSLGLLLINQNQEYSNLLWKNFEAALVNGNYSVNLLFLGFNHCIPDTIYI